MAADVQALDHAAHRDAQEFVGRGDHLVGNPRVLRAENQRERPPGDIESLGRHVLAVGRGGHDAVTRPAERSDGLRRRRMLPNVNPPLGAACDVGIRFEGAQGFDGVHLLHPERLAVADQRRGVLPVVHVLGQHGHVAGPHADRLPQHVVALGRHELPEAGDALPAGARLGAEIRQSVICGIFHRRRGFSDSFRNATTRSHPP